MSYRWTPHKSHSRCKACRRRDGLRFRTYAGIDREMGVEGPMILHEDSRLQVTSIKRGSRGKVDCAKFRSLAIKHCDGFCVQLSLIICTGNGRTKLTLVHAETRHRFERPQLIPFKALGMPLLIRKIVPAVSSRQNCHAKGTLRRDGGCNVAQSECALQKPFSDRQPMCGRASIGPGVSVRSNSLRAKEVEICISDGLGCRVEACSESLPGRQCEVCLGERIDRRDLGLIEGKG